MSKVKEQMMKQQQEVFEQELSYKEWLRESYEEPSEEEISDMQRTFGFTLNKENIHLYLYSSNNPEYKSSPKGA